MTDHVCEQTVEFHTYQIRLMGNTPADKREGVYYNPTHQRVEIWSGGEKHGHCYKISQTAKAWMDDAMSGGWESWVDLKKKALEDPKPELVPEG